MRRKDREINREDALTVLDRCEYAVLATVNPDCTPYCIPLNILREKDEIYFHCATKGQKLDNLRENPAVCLCCAGNTRIVPELYTTEYESAVVFGRAEELTDPDEKTEALRLICERHAPDHMDIFETEITRHLKQTGVWKIKIESITGKRNKTVQDETGKEGRE